jgi:hypothetical protein
MPKGSVAPLPGGVVVDVGEPVHPLVDDDVESFRDRVEAGLRALSEQRPDWGTHDEADAEGTGRQGQVG